MGLVIFSGVLVGTVFTLFVVPMFYTFISRKELVRHEIEPVPVPQPSPH
jgi:multidrug efflux pump